MDHRFKIGLIVDDSEVSFQIHNFIEWAKRQKDVNVSHLIVQNPSRDKIGTLRRLSKAIFSEGRWSRIARKCFELLVKIDLVLTSSRAGIMQESQTYLIDHQSIDTIRVVPILSRSGFVRRFESNAIEQIRSERFDLLIRFGSGILRGDILTAAKHGILSFHHGDDRKYRGGPPGFWEVYNRDDSTGFMLQILTDELDGGKIIFRGCIPTRSTYSLNRYYLYRKSFAHLRLVVKSLARDRFLPDRIGQYPYCSKIYRTPGFSHQIVYLIKTLYLRSQESLSYRIFRKASVWGVCLSRSEWSETVMSRSELIEPNKGTYIADPFICRNNGVNVCFVEEYYFNRGIGVISAFEVKKDRVERIGVVLDEGFHMSFPFIFKFDGVLYMCPETSAIREIRLYRSDVFPSKWSFYKTLLSGVSAADTMIFQWENRWWMFTNIDPSNTREHCSELYIYFTDNPIFGEWMPHLKNPIVVDSTRARNGGLLSSDANIYRVSQNQGFNHYGKSFSINKIVRLTENEYIEEVYSNVYPDFIKNISGTHHMHSDQDITVFDYIGLRRL